MSCTTQWFVLYLNVLYERFVRDQSVLFDICTSDANAVTNVSSCIHQLASQWIVYLLHFIGFWCCPCFGFTAWLSAVSSSFIVRPFLWIQFLQYGQLCSPSYGAMVIAQLVNAMTQCGRLLFWSGRDSQLDLNVSESQTLQARSEVKPEQDEQ